MIFLYVACVKYLGFSSPHSKLHITGGEAGAVGFANPGEEKFSERSIFCLQLLSKREGKPNSFQMCAEIGQEATDTV